MSTNKGQLHLDAECWPAAVQIMQYRQVEAERAAIQAEAIGSELYKEGSRGQVRGHIVELSNDISTIGRFGLDSVAACYCTPIVQEASRMHRYLSTFPPLRVLDVARIERSRLFIKELKEFQKLARLVRAGGPTKRELCSIASAFSNGSYAIFARIASAAVDVTDQKRGVALTEQETNHAQQNYSQYG